MTEQREQSKTGNGFKVSRREILTAGGATLVGAAMVGLPPSRFSKRESLHNVAGELDEGGCFTQGRRRFETVRRSIPVDVRFRGR